MPDSSSLEQTPVMHEQGGFKNAVRQALKDLADPVKESRAIEIFLNKTLIRGQSILATWHLLQNIPEPGGSSIYQTQKTISETQDQAALFDGARKDFNVIASDIFRYPKDQTPQENVKLLQFARSIYSYTLNRFLEKSRSIRDKELRKSLQGITWSIMANDIDKTLGPHGQKPISSSWRNTMRGIIFSDHPDRKLFQTELKKFESGNPEVFFQTPVTLPQSRER